MEIQLLITLSLIYFVSGNFLPDGFSLDSLKVPSHLVAHPTTLPPTRSSTGTTPPTTRSSTGTTPHTTRSSTETTPDSESTQTATTPQSHSSTTTTVNIETTTKPIVQVKLNISKILELLSKGLNSDGTITINVPNEDIAFTTGQESAPPADAPSASMMKRQQPPKIAAYSNV